MAKEIKNKNIQYVDGKLPPSAPELEEVILGALMIENCINEVVNILEPASFYKDAHVRIYTAILNLFKLSNPVDSISVMMELKRTGELDIIGGAYYLTGLTGKINSSANIEYHSRIVQQKFIQRELIRISTLSINSSYEESADVFDLLDSAEKNLFAITKNTYKKEPKTSSQLVKAVIDQLSEIMKRPDGLSGVPSGLQELDKITGGWQNSDLIIIAARPSMGKTALAVTIAKNCAMMFKIPVAIFSLEMSEFQLMKRIISAEAEINSDLLKNPKQLESWHWEQINIAIGNIANAPLFIDDTPSLSTLELKAKARRLADKHGIKLIVIDYIQLMRGDKEGNREQEISSISRNLKALAKDLNIPIIALSQLSRAVESRGGDKKPMLSDLRESGAIEQDADIVLFPHRPEYYGIKEDAHGNSTLGLAELIIAKHRDGSLDTAFTRFIGQYTKFVDIENEKKYNNLQPNKNFETEKSNWDESYQEVHT